jgi:hypothetical protein
MSLVLVGSVVTLGYYEFVYIPDQIRAPYRQVGMTDAQINELFRLYPQQNGNSTWTDLAQRYVVLPDLAKGLMNYTRSLRKSIDMSDGVIGLQRKNNVSLSELFDDLSPREVYVMAKHLGYTPDVAPYKEAFEFLKYWVKQKNLVLFDVLDQNPDNVTVWTNPKWGIVPEFNYYWLSFPQAGNVSGRALLEPIYNSSLMKQTYPALVDRETIYRGVAGQVSMCSIDVKTGEVFSGFKLKSYADNVELILSGGTFGSYTGKLYDRIEKAWNDPNYHSYPAKWGSDQEMAWSWWNARNARAYQENPNFIDLKPLADEWERDYKPVLMKDPRFQKYAFAYGLSVLDMRGIPEIYDVDCAMIYAKALGGAVFQVDIPRVTISGTPRHQTIFIPTSYQFENTLYGFGHCVGLGSGRTGTRAAGIPYLEQELPTLGQTMLWGV